MPRKRLKMAKGHIQMAKEIIRRILRRNATVIASFISAVYRK
jgi:hypothetical protein